MSVRFCTTCGRTFADDSAAVCPHDGTPLFDMAGASEAENTGLEDSPSYEESAPVESVATAFSDPETVAIPEADAVAMAQQSSSVTSVSEPSLDASLDVGGFNGFEDDDLLIMPDDASEADEMLFSTDNGEDDLPAPVASLNDALFGDESEPESDVQDAPVGFNDGFDDDFGGVVGFADDAMSLNDELPSGLSLGAEPSLGHYDVDLPDADDASSLQIAAGIESTLGELTGHESLLFDDPIDDVASESLVESMDMPGTDEPEPQTELPPIDSTSSSGGSKAPILVLVLLVLVAAAGAGWYFTMGPGAQKPVETPKVDTKTQPKTDTKVTPKVDTKADPKTDTKVDPKTDTKVEPGTDPKIDTKTDTKVDPKTDTKTDTKVDVKKDPPKKDPIKKKDPVKKVEKKDPVKKKTPIKKKEPVKTDTKKVEKKDPEKKEPTEKKKLNNELNNLLN